MSSTILNMCRSIKPLFNFDPPTTEEEVRAAALQFVRKISGMNKPSKANEAAFRAAVEDIAGISSQLLGALEVSRPAKVREAFAADERGSTLINGRTPGLA